MDHAAAVAFARTWCDDWNRHDLDAVLDHFTDDVVFTSPVAARVVPESGGVIRGKEALRTYSALALARIPDLHFTVEAVYVGVNTVVINYRNHTGALVCEVLGFDDAEGRRRRVRTGHGTYPTADASGFSGARDPAADRPAGGRAR